MPKKGMVHFRESQMHLVIVPGKDAVIGGAHDFAQIGQRPPQVLAAMVGAGTVPEGACQLTADRPIRSSEPTNSAATGQRQC